MPALSIGSARCRCAGCGEYFGGVGAFDAHQRVTRNGPVCCLPPADAGLALGPDGFWSRPSPRFNNGVGRNGAKAPDPDAQDLAPVIIRG